MKKFKKSLILVFEENYAAFQNCNFFSPDFSPLWKAINHFIFSIYLYISDILYIFIFLGYISKFWRGFFPILIVELYNDNEIEEAKPLSEEYGKLLEQLAHLFGDVHQIPIKESELKGIFSMIIIIALFM